MELRKEMNITSGKSTVFDYCAEQPVESDITLPDYFPDIVRVLKCSLTPYVSSAAASGERITADGNVHLAVLYISDDEKMHCFEQRIPYSKYVEAKSAESCAVCADAKTEYVNCRVVSRRRLDIHASVSINFKAYGKTTNQALKACGNKSVQMQRADYTVCTLRDSCVRTFSVNETVEAGSAQGCVGQIVRNEAAALLEDAKTVAGKILIKGELKVKTVFLTENDLELQHIDSSIPISQIVEADTAEDSMNMINLTVQSLEVFAKTDAGGALRLIDVTAIIRANIDIFDSEELSAATDVYSTEYELTAKKTDAVLLSEPEKFYDTYLCRGTVEMPSADISSVKDMYCAGITSETEITGNEMRIFGSMTLCFLICGADNALSCVDRQLDYEYKRALSSSGEERKCISYVTVTGTGFVLGSAGKVDARVEIDVNAAVFEAKSAVLISDIELDEDKPKKRKSASLTIYFADEGEKLWDIARRYNTTVEAVKSENGLSEDILAEKRNLLIPTV